MPAACSHVPNLDRVVLLSCEDLTGEMRRAQPHSRGSLLTRAYPGPGVRGPGQRLWTVAGHCPRDPLSPPPALSLSLLLSCSFLAFSCPLSLSLAPFALFLPCFPLGSLMFPQWRTASPRLGRMRPFPSISGIG